MHTCKSLNTPNLKMESKLRYYRVYFKIFVHNIENNNVGSYYT